jgi:hypothetical protein
MSDVTLLSRKRAKRLNDRSRQTADEQAYRLTHTIMNQVTVVYLSCATLRRRFGPDAAMRERSEIDIIELAVDRIAAGAEAPCLRLPKPATSVKRRSHPTAGN